MLRLPVGLSFPNMGRKRHFYGEEDAKVIKRLRGTGGTVKGVLDTVSKGLFGSIAYHGNYVGPGWSGGEYQNSVTSTVLPTDAFDVSMKIGESVYVG